MTHASALRQLGTTQQKLLRRLLRAPQGATVEALCDALAISHNAVRQHLTALIAAGFIERGDALLTGGRPQSRYLLTATGRELFPRNYSLIASGLIEQLYEQAGKPGVQAMLVAMGHALGNSAAERVDASDDDDEIVERLAEQLDALGYEALAVRRDGEAQVEAYNCVFHSLAKAHPDVCRFDLAFMEAATGRPVQHLECLVRGGNACRFRLGARREPDA
jgi:predicted ArsR family transcriptional regulator